MEKVLIGAGGFATEIKYHMGNPHMKMFVDDVYYNENDKNIYPLSQFDENKYEVIVAIGNPLDRFNMVSKLPKNTVFFTFIHKSAQILDKGINIGEGSIICAGCILTTNIQIGNHCHLNLQTTIGHDCIIGDYFTTAPGAKISGDCNIGSKVYVGTNTSIREKINICDNVVIGLNSGIVKDIVECGTYVGTPAKKIK
jgi:sugar O-acyltransferase (sialic acid O-acetyltransferase NeuD family)